MRTGVQSLGVLLIAAWLVVSPARAAEKGSISGTVDRPELVTAVFAKDRTSDEKDKVYPGKVDPKTGRFKIDGLPLEASYDCLIDFAGTRLEGINLKVPASDFEEEQALTKEDIEVLKKTSLAQNKFEDKIEFLSITGNVQHAAVLLNKLRTKPFYESKPGEVIWRLELWHFEKPDETWVKDQDELFIVFYRERLQQADFDKKALTLDPLLGGHKPTAKKLAVELGAVKLPAKEPGIRLRSEKK